MKNIFLVLILFSVGFPLFAQNEASSVDGKYMTLIQEIKLGGKDFKDFRDKFEEKSDWGLQEEQTINGIVLPKGYWVYVKNELPKVTEKTDKGFRVRIGLQSITQAAKAVVGSPKLYVWKQENPNPPIVTNTTTQGNSYSSSSASFFKYEIWFPSEGYYDIANMQNVKSESEGTVKIDTDAYLFQRVNLLFDYPSLYTKVTITLDGLNRNDMPMRFPLGSGAKAVVNGFSVVEGNSQIIPISSEPTYSGTESTGVLVIEKYDREKRIISGYFEFTCKTASATHKARGSFKNIPLRKVEY